MSNLNPLASADIYICHSSKAFFYAQGVTIVGEMLAPPLGAYLMRTSLWVPIIIGFMCLLFAVALTVVMPETRFTALAGDSRDDEQVHHGPGPSESEDISESRGSEGGTDIKSRFEAAVAHTLSILGFVLVHRNLVLLMACFFSTDFAQQSLAILLRYVSARYSIPLAKVFILFSPIPIPVHCVRGRVACVTPPCKDNHANSSTCRLLGQLFVLLPGVWTDAGIWHRSSPP